MFTGILALLRLIPVVGGFAEKIASAWFNAKVQITQARIGGDRDVAVALVKQSETTIHENTERLRVIAGNRLLTVLVVGFGGSLLFYYAKGVVWDSALGLGSTPALRGQLAEWSNQIIYSLFGSTTALALGHMWFANRSRD